MTRSRPPRPDSLTERVATASVMLGGLPAATRPAPGVAFAGYLPPSQSVHNFDDDRLRTDTLRGLACLLIVMFHATTEIRLFAPNSLRHVIMFNDWVSFVRVPLFTFLSGYVYAYRPLNERDRFGYLRRKARRLLLPMAFVSFVTVVAMILKNGMESETSIPLAWVKELGNPRLQLWFVEALFLIFTALSLGLYRYVFSRWFLFMAIILALAVEASGIAAFRLCSIMPAIGILPFFLAGAQLRALKIQRTHTALAIATYTLIAISFWRTLVVADVVNPIPYAAPLAALVAILVIGPKSAVLAWLGRYSMGIFLYHALILAAITPFFDTKPFVSLFFLTVLATALPILFELGLKKSWPNLLPLTLGQRDDSILSERFSA